ncbi:hypothetical protein OIO90_000602 [Microbotryomycetes sp. JL221]|nr:hypothetical protein OIO90_000602 [Microbotryomycetes sp. JL221]
MADSVAFDKVTSAARHLDSDLSSSSIVTSSRPVRVDEYADELEDGRDEDALLNKSSTTRLSRQHDRDNDDDKLDEKHGRSRSRASSIQFDFAANVLVQPSDDSTSSYTGSRRRNGAVAEPIGIPAGIALIVGMQIGSGIFSSPGLVGAQTGAVGSALLCWLGAGLLSWAGASSFCELGTALPLNGGAQAYLDAAFGPLPAYCFSFTAVTALKPGSQAIISIIFGEYICRLLYHTAFSPDPDDAARDVPAVAIKLTGIVALVAVSAIQAWSAKAGTRAQLVLTVFKVFALVLVIVNGIVFLGLGRAASTFSFQDTSSAPASYALALFSALWTFDGWDQANYVGRDCKPGTLPTIINSSMSLVLILFICANVAYFLVLDFATATATSTIGLDFGRAMAGPAGGIIFSLIVAVSCFGALNGSLYTSSRLIVAAGEQGFLPRLFAQYNDRQETPINSIILSSTLSVIFVALGDFGHLTLFYGVAAWFWYLMVIVGLFVLRVREPNLKRPYRTWLPTPILFASTALFLIVLSIFSKPWESFAAFIFCAAGAVPYYIQQRASRQDTKTVTLEMR